jgi:release factor glutamine methyltransferase
MTTIRHALQSAVIILKHVDTPSLDAELLLAYALRQPRAHLHAWPEKLLSPTQRAVFAALIKRRSQLEPIAYITGVKEFWSLPLTVTRATLIPRPETEGLVEQVLALPFLATQPLAIAELGTGSGAIAIALATERPAWHIFATDLSGSALAVAEQNAEKLQITNIHFFQGDWCNALPAQRFAIIVSNPPYIAEKEWSAYARGLEYEPREALTAGSDGLDAIKTICQQATEYLLPGGFLIIEHGFKQGAVVREIFMENGYQDVVLTKDLSNQERITVGCYFPERSVIFA